MPLNAEELLYWNEEEVINNFTVRNPVSRWSTVLASVALPVGSKALDIGCGAGRNIELLCHLGFDSYGLDISRGMLDITRLRVSAQSHPGRFNLLQGEMSSLSFCDNSFDVIISNGVFHNAISLLEMRLSLSEACRVLKTNGLLLLSMFNADFIDTDSVSNTNSEGVFTTADNLRMVLLRSTDIMSLLGDKGFGIEGEVENFVSNLDVGKRAILRTVLRKKS